MLRCSNKCNQKSRAYRSILQGKIPKLYTNFLYILKHMLYESSHNFLSICFNSVKNKDISGTKTYLKISKFSLDPHNCPSLSVSMSFFEYVGNSSLRWTHITRRVHSNHFCLSVVHLAICLFVFKYLRNN